MSFRYIHFSDYGKLNIKDNRLVYTKDDKEIIDIPVDDISAIVIESRQMVLTSYLISYCASHDILIIFCDEKHLPNAIAIPFHSFGRQRLRVEKQISLSLPFKKQLWARIVRQKIINQAKLLDKLNNETSIQLYSLADDIKSGDSDNKEGLASKIYFRSLFGENFSREDDNHAVNGLLNYAYSIVRGSISRTLVAHGFIPSLGIFHKNQYNNFNLSDDLIEPYRPIIDSYVINLFENGMNNIQSKEVKFELLKIFEYRVLHNDKKINIKQSIDVLVDTLVMSINAKDPKRLLLPEIIFL